MNEIKVSVVVPIFNCERFLKKCLGSILTQSLSEIEVICVNDGSNDNSSAIIETFSKEDNRIAIINHNLNKGLSIARQTGIKAAKGEYILFVDADDTINRDTIKNLYEAANDKQADITMMSSCRIFKNVPYKPPFFSTSKYFTKKVLEEHEIQGKILDDLLSNSGFSGSMWDKLYSTSLLKSISFQTPSRFIAEDYIFNLQVFSVAKRLTWIDYVGYNWRYSGDLKKYLIDYWEDKRNVYLYLLQLSNILPISETLKTKMIKSIINQRIDDIKFSAIQRFWNGHKKSEILCFLERELNDKNLHENLSLLESYSDELLQITIHRDINAFYDYCRRFMRKHWKFNLFMRVMDFISSI